MTQDTTLADVREALASCISAMKDQNSVIVTIAYVEANAALAKLDAMPDRVAELEAENARLYESTMDCLASLCAAHSLLSRSPKTAAPSDKMFDQMLADYAATIGRTRAALKEEAKP